MSKEPVPVILTVEVFGLDHTPWKLSQPLILKPSWHTFEVIDEDGRLIVKGMIPVRPVSAPPARECGAHERLGAMRPCLSALSS